MKQIDKYCKDILYDIGDKIWLSIRNIITNQLFKKLDYKMLGFFEIIRNKKVFIKLQLPQLMKIYNVFYPNLLKKAFIDLLINQVNKFPFFSYYQE